LAAHASQDKDPGDVVQLPEGHAAQAVAFGAAAKVPFAHREQEAAFATFEKDPALQTEQVVAFAYEPRGQEHDRPPPEPRCANPPPHAHVAGVLAAVPAAENECAGQIAHLRVVEL
jgi:hypothetical protein